MNRKIKNKSAYSLENTIKRFKSLSPDLKSFNPPNIFETSRKTLVFDKVSETSSESNSSYSIEDCKEQIKGLEEIGIFSESIYSKKIVDHKDFERIERKKTIFITDFMRKDQKTKLIKIAGS